MRATRWRWACWVPLAAMLQGCRAADEGGVGAAERASAREPREWARAWDPVLEQVDFFFYIEYDAIGKVPRDDPWATRGESNAYLRAHQAELEWLVRACEAPFEPIEFVGPSTPNGPMDEVLGLMRLSDVLMADAHRISVEGDGAVAAEAVRRRVVGSLHLAERMRRIPHLIAGIVACAICQRALDFIEESGCIEGDAGAPAALCRATAWTGEADPFGLQRAVRLEAVMYDRWLRELRDKPDEEPEVEDAHEPLTRFAKSAIDLEADLAELRGIYDRIADSWELGDNGAMVRRLVDEAITQKEHGFLAAVVMPWLDRAQQTDFKTRDRVRGFRARLCE